MKQKPKSKPAPPADWLPAARENGEGVRQTFLRIIMREMKCDETMALIIFAEAIVARKIVETGVTGLTGSVKKYKAV